MDPVTARHAARKPDGGDERTILDCGRPTGRGPRAGAAARYGMLDADTERQHDD